MLQFEVSTRSNSVGANPRWGFVSSTLKISSSTCTWKDSSFVSVLSEPGSSGVELEFSGEGINEIAKIKSSSNPNYQLKIGKEILSIDPKYFRPTEVDLLIGDPTKAKEKLGWVPEIQLEELVQDMMESDLRLFERDRYLSEGGHDTFNYFE